VAVTAPVLIDFSQKVIQYVARPPLASYTAPVEKLTADDDSQEISSAISSAFPIRAIGVKDCERARMAGSVPAFIGLSTAAGAIALTSTPVVATSLPSDFVSATTAALDAEYAL